jgi:integration host factor subunit beta
VNKFKKETYTRSNIEESLRKEFPNLSRAHITESVDAIIDTIIEAVALDEKVEIRGFGTFSKKIYSTKKIY